MPDEVRSIDERMQAAIESMSDAPTPDTPPTPAPAPAAPAPTPSEPNVVETAEPTSSKDNDQAYQSFLRQRHEQRRALEEHVEQVRQEAYDQARKEAMAEARNQALADPEGFFGPLEEDRARELSERVYFAGAGESVSAEDKAMHELRYKNSALERKLDDTHQLLKELQNQVTAAPKAQQTRERVWDYANEVPDSLPLTQAFIKTRGKQAFVDALAGAAEHNANSGHGNISVADYALAMEKQLLVDKQRYEELYGAPSAPAEQAATTPAPSRKNSRTFEEPKVPGLGATREEDNKYREYRIQRALDALNS